MMHEEFEELTGFHPTVEMYEAIEQAYCEWNGDKQSFCAAYKNNANGLAEKIARRASIAKFTADREREDAAAKRIAELEQQVERLTAALEREQEWQPYENEHNVRQADYERLERAGGTRVLSDDEAADLIAEDFGFDRRKIVIVHEVDKEEINRHHQCRRVGTLHRKALFNAWDWNYIVFSVRGMGYEMHNGQLQIYWG